MLWERWYGWQFEFKIFSTENSIKDLFLRTLGLIQIPSWALITQFDNHWTSTGLSEWWQTWPAWSNGMGLQRMSPWAGFAKGLPLPEIAYIINPIFNTYIRRIFQKTQRRPKLVRLFRPQFCLFSMLKANLTFVCSYFYAFTWSTYLCRLWSGPHNQIVCVVKYFVNVG